MDFELDETQRAVHEAVHGVLSRGPVPATAWRMLQDSGVHALAIPERYGGAGLGAVEVGIVAQALGEAALNSPYVSAGIAAMVASRTATGVDIGDWCKGMADGELTAVSVRAAGQRGVPELAPESRRVTGRFGAAQHARDARWLVVPTTAGPALVDLAQDGVSMTPVHCSLGTETPDTPVDGQFELTEARCTPLFTGQPDALDLFEELHGAVFLSYASGLLKGALRLTADHLGARKQFGRPLATFQAAAQEIADIYVLATALESVALYCNWTIDNGGRPTTELAAALFMFAGEGRAAMQMCHHLHGGLGVDITYPMHRYFSSAKDVVRHCGGERHNLRRLGTRCSSD
ncbi:acyl-CoA dehydrogenase family protein [Nocardia sp. NPDC051321]|uniref:acyl-CoA dehydrogenase family protein n=1 Tax=Nocardia sp. NPDC051321 TaxID=3364323 RepID=UPI00379AB4F8